MQRSSKRIIYFFHAFAAAAWLSVLIPQAGLCGAKQASFTQVPMRSRTAVVEHAYNVDFDEDERRARILAGASQGLLARQLPSSPTRGPARANNRAYLDLSNFDVVLLI